MLLAAPAAVLAWGAPKAPDPAAKPSIWELPGRLGEVDVTLEANAWTSDKIEEADGASLRAAAQQVLSAP